MKYSCLALVLLVLSGCVTPSPSNARATETAITSGIIAQLTASAPTATPSSPPTSPRSTATTGTTRPSAPQPTSTRQSPIPVPTKTLTPQAASLTLTTQVNPPQSVHRFVASSKAKKYYYCDTDPAWHDLSPKNLLWFDTEEEARHATGMVLHAPCR